MAGVGIRSKLVPPQCVAKGRCATEPKRCGRTVHCRIRNTLCHRIRISRTITADSGTCIARLPSRQLVDVGDRGRIGRNLDLTRDRDRGGSLNDRLGRRRQVQRKRICCARSIPCVDHNVMPARSKRHRSIHAAALSLVNAGAIVINLHGSNRRGRSGRCGYLRGATHGCAWSRCCQENAGTCTGHRGLLDHLAAGAVPSLHGHGVRSGRRVDVSVDRVRRGLIGELPIHVGLNLHDRCGSIRSSLCHDVHRRGGGRAIYRRFHGDCGKTGNGESHQGNCGANCEIQNCPP